MLFYVWPAFSESHAKLVGPRLAIQQRERVRCGAGRPVVMLRKGLQELKPYCLKYVPGES